MKIKYVALFLCYAFISLATYAAEHDESTPEIPEKFTLAFAKFSHDYSVVAPKGNLDVRIVYIPDFSDNIIMGEQASAAIVQKLVNLNLLRHIEAVIVPGDKANMLATLLHQKIAKHRTASSYGLTELVIFRSAEKGDIEHSVKYDSITGGGKTLNSRVDQGERIKEKGVLLFDDVVSLGGTLKATTELVKHYDCKVIAYSCVATEGEERTHFEGLPLIHLVHLPVWVIANQ